MTVRNIVIVVVVLIVVGSVFVASGGAATFTAKPTPTPDFTAMSELENLITASGTLVPAKRANLSFKVAGYVLQVEVKPGDKVIKGNPLVRLESAEAQAAVEMAQAQLTQLQAGATKEEIAVAQAALDTAQAQLARVRVGPTVEDVAIAKATLERAMSALRDAQSAYDKIKDDPQAGMYPESATYEAASQQYKIAEATFNRTVKGTQPEDIRIAELTVAAAQANLNRVKAGARPEEIAAARARLEQAQLAGDATILTAPFNGTIAAVNIREGEMAAPGVPVITLGDLSKLRLETDDLSETNIARVKTGQPVDVTFEALPGKTFPGAVTDIAYLSSQKQGGTNYMVTVEFAQLDSVLRWGMTGHIEINAK